MRLLNMMTLTDAGLVIAGKPAATDRAGELLRVTVTTKDFKNITVADDAVAVRCYSDKILIVSKDENIDMSNGICEELQPRGNLIKVTSMDEKQLTFWSILCDRTLTAVIEYERVNKHVVAIGAAIFIGKDGDKDEVLFLQNDPTLEEELEVLIPRYTEYYRWMLS